jgi:hypothetical protein
MTYVLDSFPLIVAPILWRSYGGSLSASGCALRAQALYKQVGTLLPNVWEPRPLRLWAVRTATAAESEGGPSRLSVWTRPYGVTFWCSLVTRARRMGARQLNPGVPPSFLLILRGPFFVLLVILAVSSCCPPKTFHD